MLPAAIATETVTRLRGVGSTNGYNDAAIDWGQTPAELAIAGCSVQPVDGEEVLDGRDAVVSRWRWFGPYDADVTAKDRIRHRGVVYSVDGSIEKWIDPTGSGLDHATCLLRRTDG